MKEGDTPKRVPFRRRLTERDLPAVALAAATTAATATTAASATTAAATSTTSAAAEPAATTAAASTTSAAAESTATTAAAVLPLFGLVDAKRASVEERAVHLGDGLGGLCRGAHRDEREAT
jgi:hypothetical protein